MEMNELFEEFGFEGKFESCRRFGNGHINDTYELKVTQASVERYLLQRVNSDLFTDVPALMRNIRLVTDHLRKKIVKRGGDPLRGTLSIIRTKDGKDYFFDGDNYWRAYRFIENATAYQSEQATENLFYAAGIGFGRFANDLSDFDAMQLTEVLPRFHDTRKRYDDFIFSARQNRHGRVPSAYAELAFLQTREYYCDLLNQLTSQGLLPMRVTLNDTKLDNVMIDNDTRRVVSVIDLDTVMKGSLTTDFGDAIRFGCNSAAEDEPDVLTVWFRTDMFTAYTRGYMEEVYTTITQEELDHLVDGAILMTYEQALRFLADYFNGDVYYHTTHPTHNLERARTQIKLLSEMETKRATLQGIVMSEYRRALEVKGWMPHA